MDVIRGRPLGAPPEGFAAAPGEFVVQVIGESMNRRIPNGVWRLLRAAPAGSRQGRVVLVLHRDATDPEMSGRYTVKRYQSEMQGDGEGGRHDRSTLVPGDEGTVRVELMWLSIYF